MDVLFVVHGPEPVDSGLVMTILSKLERHRVTAIMGGVTGKAAVIDAGMEDVIDITSDDLPSKVIIDRSMGMDVVLLVNEGRSPESTSRFASIIGERITDVDVPVILVDPNMVAMLRGHHPVIGRIAELMGVQVTHPPSTSRGEGDRRTIGPLAVGDPVWIDGNVVGFAESDEVSVWKGDDGFEFDGLSVKEHGLQKIRPDVDLDSAVIRSGRIRRTTSVPRRRASVRGDEAVLIDHDAERWVGPLLSDSDGIGFAITVGDDTTRVASSLLLRADLPIIGITDGDEDGICDERVMHERSVIIRLRTSNDDRIGTEVRERLFEGGCRARLPQGIDAVAREIESMASDVLVEVIRGGPNP